MIRRQAAPDRRGRPASQALGQSVTCTQRENRNVSFFAGVPFDFQVINVRQLADDVAVLSYVATQDASCGGEKLPPKVYATSVYVRHEGKWLSTNYQETPLP